MLTFLISSVIIVQKLFNKCCASAGSPVYMDSNEDILTENWHQSLIQNVERSNPENYSNRTLKINKLQNTLQTTTQSFFPNRRHDPRLLHEICIIAPPSNRAWKKSDDHVMSNTTWTPASPVDFDRKFERLKTLMKYRKYVLQRYLFQVWYLRPVMGTS